MTNNLACEAWIGLAERVEALTGPDREVDCLIWAEVSPNTDEAWIAEAPAYTASLDAAMTLVPGTWTNIEQHRHRMEDGSERSYAKIEFELPLMILSDEGRAATPALALCAAALRARATSQAQGD